MKNKSKLFQLLNEEQINLIFENHSLHVDSYRLLHGGLFNTTYSVKCGDERYILQAGSTRTDLLLPFEKYLGEAEIYVCNLLQKNNIAANKPFFSDFSKQILDRDYVIFSYIDGINMSDKDVKNFNKGTLQKQVGAVAKKIHGISGDYYGRVSDSFNGITFSTWQDYIFYELKTTIDSCKKQNVLNEKCLNEIEDLFQKGKLYFDYTSAPRLVHMDLWEGNVIIDKDQTQVLAIIDTDRCLFGDPDMDLATPWLITPDFLEGYGELPSSEFRETKLLYYQLLCAVIDAYVWKAEYCNRLEYFKSCRKIKSLMKKIKNCIK